MAPLLSEAKLQIRKSPAEVYNAIVDPVHMTKYFISESSGRLEHGVDRVWKFPEFDERFTVSNVTLRVDSSISFVWDPETVVTINLHGFGNDTVVHVIETGKQFTDENMQWLVSNVAGWSNFLACLKAYLEYGVGLRKGAYDFMRSEDGI